MTRAAPHAPIALFAFAALLAGCDSKASVEVGDGASELNDSAVVSIADGSFKLNAGPIDASINVPGIKLSGDDMDIDGMKLYPGSVVKGVLVKDEDTNVDGGRVEIKFESSDPVADLKTYYMKAAPDAGFAVTPTADGLTGAKDNDHRFAIALKPTPAGGSTGTLTVEGK